MPSTKGISPAEYQKLIRAEKRRFIRQYKAASGCADCGERDPVVLELDHRSPEEKRTNARRTDGRKNGNYLRWTVMGWDDIKNELDKCDVRCANCHRRKHHIENGWG